MLWRERWKCKVNLAGPVYRLTIEARLHAPSRFTISTAPSVLVQAMYPRVQAGFPAGFDSKDLFSRQVGRYSFED